MSPWFRIPGGWAANLDGTNAGLVFSLPRVEVRSSPTGWTSECFFRDGTRAVCAPPYQGGAASVMNEAMGSARRLLAVAHPVAAAGAGVPEASGSGGAGERPIEP